MDATNFPAAKSRAAFFLLFLFSGLILFVLFNHIQPVLPAPVDWIGRILLTTVFLAAALWTRRNPRLEKYWRLLFAFFIAALAMTVDLYLPSSAALLNILRVDLHSPAGLALDKLDSSLILVLCILLLTKASGADLGSIYLQKGNLARGLTIGLTAFAVAAAGSIPVSAAFFGGNNLSVERIIPWTPWVLIFVLGNAFSEELLFRGLFLQKFSPFTGKALSNLAIAVPFALHHGGVSYTPAVLMFLALLLPLGLVWGWITQKTDAVWGSVLFHAGTDIPIILGLFSALG
jgi:membrane protease YdiL (CAAX protease family)